MQASSIGILISGFLRRMHTDGAWLTQYISAFFLVIPPQDPNKNWEHISCACSFYADMRDLDGLGFQHVCGTWIFGRILESDDRTRRFTKFAEEVGLLKPIFLAAWLEA